jgi:hypothetical protein
MTKVYIAGPMQGKHLNNFQEFEDSMRWLQYSMGWDVVSAHDLAINDGEANISARYDYVGEYRTRQFDTVEFTPLSGEHSMRSLVSIMPTLDAIVMLPSWQESHGAVKEIMLAKWCGLRDMLIERVENGFRLSEGLVSDATLSTLYNAHHLGRLVTRR